jgi:hypothetical protein
MKYGRTAAKIQVTSSLRDPMNRLDALAQVPAHSHLLDGYGRNLFCTFFLAIFISPSFLNAPGITEPAIQSTRSAGIYWPPKTQNDAKKVIVEIFIIPTTSPFAFFGATRNLLPSYW